MAYGGQIKKTKIKQKMIINWCVTDPTENIGIELVRAGEEEEFMILTKNDYCV